MFRSFQLAAKYFRYYLSASNGKGHGVHSPFVYNFIRQVLNDRARYPEYERVEALRRRLQKDRSVLRLDDPGAGSHVSGGHSRRVSSIAKYAAKPAKYGQLLFRMVRYYRPATLLDMGTSLGITSSYLALANPGMKMISLEGASPVSAIARKNFEALEIRNITLVEGNFDTTLPSLLEGGVRPDFAFIDGNHRLEPTLRYFHQLLPHCHSGSILVFDDIHWSREMEKAWRAILEDPAVRCSIDLFFLGIVFFREEFREKQRFRVRF